MNPRLLLPLAALVVTGCGAGGGHAANTAPAPLSVAGSASPPGGAVTTAPGPTRSGASAGKVSSGAGAVILPSGHPSSPAAAGRSPGAAPATGAAPGTYTYDASGTFDAGAPEPVSGTATLTVDGLAGGHQHSVMKTQRGSTDEDLTFPADGTHLDQLTITNAAFTKAFKPSPSVLLLPQPQTVGSSWTWSATSTDGRTTASATNKITKREVLTIGGETVSCAVIESVLTLSGDLSYRGDTTTWYSAVHRVAVKEHEKGSGNVNGFAFSSDITSVLRSTTPS